jgi:transposase-like protein
MKKKSGMTRQTKHKLAKSNPEVKERIAKLKKLWKRSKREGTEEFSTLVIELVETYGCSIRGLARELGVPPTTMRQLSKPSADAKLDESNTTANHSQVAAQPKTKANTKQPATGAAVAAQENVASPEASKPPQPNLSVSQALAVLAARKPIKVVEKPPLQVPTHPNDDLRRSNSPSRPESQARHRIGSLRKDRPESLALLRGQAEQIIEDLIRSNYGMQEIRPNSERILAVFANARTHICKQRPGFTFFNLPDPSSVSELLDKTKPRRAENQPESEFLGRWVAVTLNSLWLDDEGAREVTIEQVRRKLSPKPEKKNTAPGDRNARPVRRPAQIYWG